MDVRVLDLLELCRDGQFCSLQSGTASVSREWRTVIKSRTRGRRNLPPGATERSFGAASVLMRDTTRNRPSRDRASQHWRVKALDSGTPNQPAIGGMARTLLGASGRLISTAKSHQFANDLAVVDRRNGATGVVQEADIGVNA